MRTRFITAAVILIIAVAGCGFLKQKVEQKVNEKIDEQGKSVRSEEHTSELQSP